MSNGNISFQTQKNYDIECVKKSVIKHFCIDRGIGRINLVPISPRMVESYKPCIEWIIIDMTNVATSADYFFFNLWCTIKNSDLTAGNDFEMLIYSRNFRSKTHRSYLTSSHYSIWSRFKNTMFDL